MIDAECPDFAALRISGRAYFEVRNVPVTLTAKIRFQSASVVSSMVFSISMPAALTSTSSRCGAFADLCQGSLRTVLRRHIESQELAVVVSLCVYRALSGQVGRVDCRALCGKPCTDRPTHATGRPPVTRGDFVLQTHAWFSAQIPIILASNESHEPRSVWQSNCSGSTGRIGVEHQAMEVMHSMLGFTPIRPGSWTISSLLECRRTHTTLHAFHQGNVLDLQHFIDVANRLQFHVVRYRRLEIEVVGLEGTRGRRPEQRSSR